jgi:hypothetical protein
VYLYFLFLLILSISTSCLHCKWPLGHRVTKKARSWIEMSQVLNCVRLNDTELNYQASNSFLSTNDSTFVCSQSNGHPYGTHNSNLQKPQTIKLNSKQMWPKRVKNLTIFPRTSSHATFRPQSVWTWPGDVANNTWRNDNKMNVILTQYGRGSYGARHGVVF